MMPRSVIFLACAAMLPMAAQAQDAYVWANNATEDRYTPDVIYSFNPRGNISIRRRGVGQYTVTFFGLGTAPERTPGEGGHVQVTTYGSSDRCNIGNWGYAGENFVVNVNCFEAASDRNKDSRFALSVRNRPFGFVTLNMEIGNEELQALQIALAELTARVEALEAP